jgi:hypothetical protein
MVYTLFLFCCFMNCLCCVCNPEVWTFVIMTLWQKFLFYFSTYLGALHPYLISSVCCVFLWKWRWSFRGMKPVMAFWALVSMPDVFTWGCERLFVFQYIYGIHFRLHDIYIYVCDMHWLLNKTILINASKSSSKYTCIVIPSEYKHEVVWETEATRCP